jgi:hypothetical protein
MARFILFLFLFTFSFLNSSLAATKPPLVPDPMLESFSTLTNDVIRWKTLPISIQNHFGERSDFFLPQVQEFSKFIHNDENNRLNPISLSNALKRKVPSCTDTFRIPNRKIYSTVKSAVKALWESLEGTVYRAAIVRAYDGDTSDDKLKRKFFSALLQESYKDTDKGASGFEILLNIFRPAVSPLQVKEKFTTTVNALLTDGRSIAASTLTDSGVSADDDEKEPSENPFSTEALDVTPCKKKRGHSLSQKEPNSTTTAPSPFVTYGFMFGGVVVLTAILNPEATGRAVRTLRNWFRG